MPEAFSNAFRGLLLPATVVDFACMCCIEEDLPGFKEVMEEYADALQSLQSSWKLDKFPHVSTRVDCWTRHLRCSSCPKGLSS